MNIRRSRTRRTGVGLLVIAAAALGACSSETKRSIDDASTTVASSSTTVLADVTTTLAAATTVPVEATTIPVVTDAPSTIPAPQPTDPPATDAPGFGLYDEVSPPGVPSGHTDPFASSGVLGNGVYWVQYNGGETFTPDIEVTQAFFGAECETQAAAAGDECLNDIFMLGDPSREIDDLPFADDVFLSVADANTQKSYWITPDELRSVRASSPSDPAPDGYGFASFPWKMTVQGGMIVKFEQVWVP